MSRAVAGVGSGGGGGAVLEVTRGGWRRRLCTRCAPLHRARAPGANGRIRLHNCHEQQMPLVARSGEPAESRDEEAAREGAQQQQSGHATPWSPWQQAAARERERRSAEAPAATRRGRTQNKMRQMWQRGRTGLCEAGWRRGIGVAATYQESRPDTASVARSVEHHGPWESSSHGWEALTLLRMEIKRPSAPNKAADAWRMRP